nr:NAAT family transporter [candidate division Zixibacteria bacterium]
MLIWQDYLEIFTAIIVIVDPLGLIPIFVSVTSDQTPSERDRTARVAVVAAGIILIIVALLGEMVLGLFGIRIASFQVGGGLLILLLSISMLNARVSSSKHTPEEALEAESKNNVAVVPLAVPLLAGPAAMSTIIIYANRYPGWSMKIFLILCIIVVAFLVWLALKVSLPLIHKLGRTGVNNVTRIMGLLLAAIAVEFIASGLGELFPGLK